MDENLQDVDAIQAQNGEPIQAQNGEPIQEESAATLFTQDDVDRLVAIAVANVKPVIKVIDKSNDDPSFRQGDLYCIACIGDWILARKKAQLSTLVEGADPVELPPIRPAVTFVPVWQQQQVPGGMAMACVALPHCLGHIDSTEKTAEQKAMEGGFLLPGRGSI